MTMSDDKKPDWCLLCFSPVVASLNSSIFHNDLFKSVMDCEKKEISMSRHLHVIFLLKNCLDLPTERLSYYLYKWGSPENWVGLCSTCTELVKDTKKIHREIIMQQKRFREAKWRLVEILKESANKEVMTRDSSEYKKQPKEKKKAMEITNLTRCFVKQNKLAKLEDPFISGDNKATELLRKLHPATSCGLSSFQGGEMKLKDFTMGPFDNIPEMNLIDDDEDGNFSDVVETSDTSDSEDESSDDGSDSDGGTEKKLKERMLTKEKGDSPPKKSSNGNEIRCSVCNKQFGSVELRDAHEQVHQNDANSLRHKCPFCQRGFSRMDYYRIHVRSHKVHDKPKITKEDRQLAKAQEKERKMKEKQRKYPCTECDDAFPKLKLLEAHLVDEHKGEVAPVVCDLCGKFFSRELSLKKHVKKVHETERKYNLHCTHCGMGMKSPGKLKKHLKEAHAIWEMDQYFCEMEGCKKKYQFKVDFEVHMAKHVGSAPYQCEHCGRDFWQSQQMRKHVVVMHSGNRESKPYKCEICGKGFAIKHYVYTHKRKVHFKKKQGKPNFPYYEESTERADVSQQHDFGQYSEPSNSSSIHMM